MTAASQTDHAGAGYLQRAAHAVDEFQAAAADDDLRRTHESNRRHLAPTGLGRLVVGFDGSSSGRDALRFTAVLARWTHAKLTVACVFPPESLAGLTFEPRATRIATGDHRIFVRQDADAVLREARARVPDDLAVAFRPVEAESPLDGLRQIATSEMADALIFGSSDRGVISRVRHRSLASRALRHASCAVGIAPTGFRTRPRAQLRVLAAADDGSPASGAALNAAAALAAEMASKASSATILRVVAVQPEVRSDQQASDVQRASEAGMLGRLANLGTVGVELDAIKGAGLAGQIAVQAIVSSEDHDGRMSEIASDIDCLILGLPRRRSVWRHSLLQRGSAKMLQRAVCPVLIVPAGARAPFLAGRG